MKGLAISYEGTEEVMSNEIKEILKLDSEVSTEPSAVIFDAKREDLFKLAYLGQSFSHCIELIHSFYITEFEDIEKIKDLDFKEFEDKNFRVNCIRIGDHEFNSVDVEKDVGGYILDQVKCKVDLTNPERILFVYIYKGKCYVGIDWNNLDLSKRDYNVHPHSKSIKGTLAFAMLMFANYDKEKVLLDPFCLSGIIPLEAAYYATKLSLNFFRKNKFLFVKHNIAEEDFLKQFDIPFPTKQEKIHAFDYELRNLTAAKHNAKIGEIDKALDFRKVESEWLDTKFDEESIDLIVTSPPPPTFKSEKYLKKRYHELFYNAEFVLKKEGKLVIKESKLIRLLGDRSKLELIETKEVKKGSNVVKILVYHKNFPNS
jgi:putative N6-adenine-specific DNA methylase